MVQSNTYAITAKFFSTLDNKIIHVSNVYGPSNSAEKLSFLTWLMNLDTSDYDNWVLGCDFNLIRSPKNRNKPGGDLSEMNMFNELISDLDLVDLPFSRNFT